MSNLPFLVSSFQKDLVSILIKECFGADFPDVSHKSQIRYLMNYLDSLGCKTVVCETSYVDKNYLDDYVSYYAKCFSDYSAKCARLHFFSSHFEHDDFKEFLSNSKNEVVSDLQDNYLGFSVIKPLPQTFLGRTCLKVYPDVMKKDDRHCLTKTYKASLFGIDLKVKSIAFQEQDKVVSACATTSLWSLLHATSHFDHDSVPSPSEITLSALSDVPLEINGFPNQGLKHEEIQRALEKLKLKHYEFRLTEDDDWNELSEYLKSYIDSDIPVLVGADVWRATDGKVEPLGSHAVTLLGYRLNQNRKISAIYVHDDRIGPYCYCRKDLFPIGLIGNDEKLSEKQCFSVEIFKNSAHDNHEKIKDFIVPRTITIASYPKVRLPFDIIYSTCSILTKSLNTMVEELDEKAQEERSHFGFKAEIRKSNELKRLYFRDGSIKNREKILTTSMPKYVWHCRFHDKSYAIFDLIFDATDIPQGSPLICYGIIDPEAFDAVCDGLDGLVLDTNPYRNNENRPKTLFFSTIRAIKRLQESEGFFEKLNELYGELRPPKYIKPDEVGEYDFKIQLDREEFLTSSGNDGSLLKGMSDNVKKIWVISEHGTLLIGDDSKTSGHPTLTGARPARVGGEIYKSSCGKEYLINSKSGRYSKMSEDYRKYLGNALCKFKEVFPNVRFAIDSNFL